MFYSQFVISLRKGCVIFNIQPISHRQLKAEPEFVNLLRSPGIDSLPGRNYFLGSLNVYKYWLCFVFHSWDDVVLLGTAWFPCCVQLGRHFCVHCSQLECPFYVQQDAPIWFILVYSWDMPFVHIVHSWDMPLVHIMHSWDMPVVHIMYIWGHACCAVTPPFL
jgi:hypothetical protein